MTQEFSVICLAMPHGQAHTYNAVVSERNPVPDHAATTYETAIANDHSAIEYCAGRDMTVISNYRVMFYQCTRVDDAVAAYPCAGINDGTVHYDCAWTNAGMGGNMGRRRDNGRQLETKLDGLFIDFNSPGRGTALADSNKRVLMFFHQLWQISVRSDHGITVMLIVQLLGHTDKARDSIMAVLFDDVYAGMGVPTSTDKYCAGLTHVVAVANARLLRASFRSCSCRLSLLFCSALIFD